MPGARGGQFLSVQAMSDGAAMDYRIINPDGSRLLDMVASGTP
ncbi:hypothetical protein [Primorskyibacter sp. 2E233]